MARSIIDTHVHVWDLQKADYPWLKGDRSLLNNTWTIDQLEEERKKTNVKAGVLVQAAGNIADTDNMLDTARQTPWIAGVVTWLPLVDPPAIQRLLEERFLKEPYFKGVRHQVHDEPDAKWLLQPVVIESLRILAGHDIPYDIVGIKPEHIETVLRVAEKVPGLRMVFDHLNQPPIAKTLRPFDPSTLRQAQGSGLRAQDKFGRWGELMKTAAAHRNFYAKISGLGTTSGNFDGWKADDIKPYIEFVLQHFGSDRCFCGGDWPVALLAGSYSQAWKAYEEVIDALMTTEESEKIFYTNAKQFYKLAI
jgi:L-fuconolactonase